MRQRRAVARAQARTGWRSVEDLFGTRTISNQNNNLGFKTGIRIGSAKDGKVTSFIPTPSAEVATPEGVGFDDAGDVYGSWTGKMAVRRWTKG